MLITMVKVEPEIWLYLVQDNVKMPQLRIWWDMKGKDDKDMKEFAKMLEAEEDRKNDVYLIIRLEIIRKFGRKRKRERIFLQIKMLQSQLWRKLRY
jgi:hypothetical protein